MKVSESFMDDDDDDGDNNSNNNNLVMIRKNQAGATLPISVLPHL